VSNSVPASNSTSFPFPFPFPSPMPIWASSSSRSISKREVRAVDRSIALGRENIERPDLKSRVSAT
jgi:hypothetical protein